MKNILVVDDEEAIQVTMVEWFASAHPDANFNILVADNGIEAIKSLSSYKVDLLITDLIMPDMNGQELSKHIKKMYPGSNILFTSGYTDDHLVDSGELEKDIEFLQKPFTVQALLTKIRSILDKNLI